VYVLFNLHIYLRRETSREVGKLQSIWSSNNYTTHMDYADFGEMMANNYNICRRTWKCTDRLPPFLRPHHSDFTTWSSPVPEI
jgi:hypothetical protein